MSVPARRGRMLHGDDELPPWVATPAEGLTTCQPNKPKLSIQTSHLQFKTGLIFPLKIHNMRVYFLQLFQAGYPNCWQTARMGLPWIRSALIHMKYIIALSPEW